LIFLLIRVSLKIFIIINSNNLFKRGNLSHKIKRWWRIIRSLVH